MTVFSNLKTSQPMVTSAWIVENERKGKRITFLFSMKTSSDFCECLLSSWDLDVTSCEGWNEEVVASGGKLA